MKKLWILLMMPCVLLAEQLVIPSLPVPKLQTPTIQNFLTDGAKFVDKRNIYEDKNFLANNANIRSWISAYDRCVSYPEVDYIAISEPFKMIAQVFVPENGDYTILEQNLSRYKALGYDSVLFCFTGKESIGEIQRCLRLLQGTDMKIWAVYTKNGNLTCSVFDITAEKYEEILVTIAPYLTGYINSWKRTSVHLFKQDDAFMKFTNHTLRSVNPSIYLVGEFYYGEVYGLNFTQYKVRPRIVVDFGQNMFPNASGCMIVNYGTLYTDFDYLFSNVLKNQIKQHTQFIGLVSARQNKDVIERAFMKQGCIGTITLPGSNEEFNLSTQRMEEK